MFTVGRPVLLDRNIESEGSKLQHVAAVEAGSEERGTSRFSIDTNKAECLAVGRDIRIVTAQTNSLTIVSVNIHAPESVIITCGIKAMEHNPTVGGKGRIVLADTRVWKLDNITAIGVHDRYIGASSGVIVLEDNLASVRRPVRTDCVAVHMCDLKQIIAVRTHRVNLKASICLGCECYEAVLARKSGVGSLDGPDK
jgi:hypothetical protein